MATYNKFNDFSNQVLRGTHNFASDVFKVMLTSVAPVAANSVKADLTEITGSGYPGTNTTTITFSNSGTTTTIRGTKVVFTASGGTIPTSGTFRYAVLYNDTATNKNLVAWWDYGTTVSLNAGETFSVIFSNTDPGDIVSVG